jgi:hypothetical protein
VFNETNKRRFDESRTRRGERRSRGERQVGIASITHPHLLLCEGMHDVQFFYYLREVRSLPAFQAVSCGYIAGAPPGRDGVDYLTGALNALPALPTFFSKLKSILIVADNDRDPATSLKKIQRYIGAAIEIQPGVRYAIPAAEQTAAGANPTITVLMLPWTGTPGALDNLCLAAAQSKEPAIAACVDSFERCINPIGWEPQRVAKMKLRAHISAAYSDPYISPAWVWRDNTNLVPLTDAVFNQIETFLRGFLV